MISNIINIAATGVQSEPDLERNSKHPGLARMSANWKLLQLSDVLAYTTAPSDIGPVTSSVSTIDITSLFHDPSFKALMQ